MKIENVALAQLHF